MGNKKIAPCGEVRYREFPDMLFTTTDKSVRYFNAGELIRDKATECSLDDFQNKFKFWIALLKEAYNLSDEDLFVWDEEGNLLLEESLALLFMAYLDPGFAIHILERISEMLMTGIVLSDTTLIRIAAERLSNEDLMQLIKENTNQ